MLLVIYTKEMLVIQFSKNYETLRKFHVHQLQKKYS